VSRTIRKAAPNTRAWRPNASGTASAATNIAAIATSIVPHTQPGSGSTVFVNQAKAAHVHQSAARMSRACPSPPHVALSDSTVVTWVSAKTKTRSK
jgi:hypothetical protein